MELRVLRYFVEAAREESMTGAARKLHVTQPTLSKQIKELEEELGQKLFVRGNYNIRLTPEGEILTLDNDTMEFGYRTSIIRNRNFTVLSVIFRLQEGDRDEIRAKIEDFQKRRMEKQPLNYPSAGSTFKRPEGYFAGKLIMDAGLRGFQIGDARVSDKHCGFVVNVGKATARDVTDVIEEVQEKVRERFGVSLEREVIYLGEF